MKHNKIFFTKGKYSTLELNAILLDKRTLFESQIPESFQIPSVWHFVLSTLLRVVKIVVVLLIRAPLKYKFAHPDDYSEWYNNTTLFVLPTINNQNALNNVIIQLDKNQYEYRLIKSEYAPDCYPLLRMNFISLLNLPFLWKEFSHSSNEAKRIIAYYASIFVSSPGYPWFYFKVLSKFRPKCVIISNDHSCPTKCLELVCEDMKIETIYVQHASVSYAFPELHFSYSFLDGMDAFNKYTSGEKKSTGEIFLLGAVRYDNLNSYRIGRLTTKRNCIGIAINPLDDNLIVNDFCNRLLEKNPEIRIKIRSHPSMKNVLFSIDNKNCITYTCACDESIVKYLDSIDLQIAGDSGVHFDAIIGGVASIAYNFSNNAYGDNYGYVHSGIVKYAHNFEELIEYLMSNLDVDENIVRCYDEAFRKSYAGKCSEIVADFIMSGCSIDAIKSKYALSVKNSEEYNFYTIVR